MLVTSKPVPLSQALVCIDFLTLLSTSKFVCCSAVSRSPFCVLTRKTYQCIMNSDPTCHKDVTGNALSCENNIGSELPAITLNYRPRGSLARTLYEKQQNDYYLTHLDKMQVSIQYIATFISPVSGKQLKLAAVR